MKPKLIIGLAIIIIFSIWAASAFFKTTLRYVSIEEAKTSTRSVQVMGKIDFDRVNYNVDQARLEFEIYDSEANDSHVADRMKIVYYGTIPGNFDQATSVVVKGKSENNVFVADQLLVKCPSKYQGESDEGYQDITKHQGDGKI